MTRSHLTGGLHRAAACAALVAALGLAGCASAPTAPGADGAATSAGAENSATGSTATATATANGKPGVGGGAGFGLPTRIDPRDPWEPFNRRVWAFNEALDRVLLKPLANAYTTVVPTLIRRGINNFFNNLSDFGSFVNSALQGKGDNAVHNLMRFQLNTVFGLGGLLDIATEANIPRNREDFGKTLGAWGVPLGPYVVLPLLGPSSVRDTAAKVVDIKTDLLTQFPEVYERNSLQALKVVDLRAQLLKTTELLQAASIDSYAFTRDAYLQMRQHAGQSKQDADAPPPPEEDFSKPADDPANTPAAPAPKPAASDAAPTEQAAPIGPAVPTAPTTPTAPASPASAPKPLTGSIHTLDDKASPIPGTAAVFVTPSIAPSPSPSVAGTGIPIQAAQATGLKLNPTAPIIPVLTPEAVHRVGAGATRAAASAAS